MSPFPFRRAPSRPVNPQMPLGGRTPPWRQSIPLPDGWQRAIKPGKSLYPTLRLRMHPMEYPLLLEPIVLAGRTVRNRVVHASMSTRYSQGQDINPRIVRYHANRAAGGAGMIVTEPLNVLPWQQLPHRPSLVKPGNRSALARWAASVESKDCRLLGQFQDSGRGHRESGRSQQAWAPSALPDDLSWTMPRKMPRHRIHEAIEHFGRGARRLEEAGFSGVELSAGHGHLFHQFLSPAANIRTDEYGGDLEGRTRFLREIIQIISRYCKDNFIIGLKLPANDGIPGGVNHSESRRITARLAEDGGFHYLVYCDGSHSNSLEAHVPDMSYPRSPYVDGHAEIASSAPGVPLMALGLITDPAEAEGILAAGKAQMIAMGRPLVTDAAWVKKAAEGRQSEIRYCVSCNTCWATIVERRPIACDNNPRLGQRDEVDYWPRRARRKRRLVVVGAGPAGLETAWVAAARGHSVVIYGASERPGGKAWLHAQLPGGENMSSVYDYQEMAANKAGARLRLGFRAAVDDVLRHSPDIVVLAGGATMLWPASWPPEWRDFVLDVRAVGREMLERPAATIDGTAVLWDQDHTLATYAAAELLAQRFARLVIVTPRERLASDVGLVTRQGIYRRLYGMANVEVVLLSGIDAGSALDEGRVSCRNVLNGAIREIADLALLTWSGSRTPNDELAAPLRTAGMEVVSVGDCDMPRTLLAATADGHALGRSL